MIFTLALAAAAMTGQSNNMVAQSDESGEAMQRILVHYDDLDLSTSAGAATIDRRVWRAARKICLSPTSNEFAQSLDLGGCEAAIIGRARRQVASAVARARASRLETLKQAAMRLSLSQ